MNHTPGRDNESPKSKPGRGMSTGAFAMCMAFVAGSGFCFAAATDCVGLAKVGLCLLSATLGIIAINVSYVIGHDDGQVPQ